MIRRGQNSSREKTQKHRIIPQVLCMIRRGQNNPREKNTELFHKSWAWQGGGRIIQEKKGQNYSSSPGHGKEGAE